MLSRIEAIKLRKEKQKEENIMPERKLQKFVRDRSATSLSQSWKIEPVPAEETRASTKIKENYELSKRNGEQSRQRKEENN